MNVKNFVTRNWSPVKRNHFPTPKNFELNFNLYKDNISIDQKYTLRRHL